MREKKYQNSLQPHLVDALTPGAYEVRMSIYIPFLCDIGGQLMQSTITVLGAGHATETHQMAFPP